MVDRGDTDPGYRSAAPFLAELFVSQEMRSLFGMSSTVARYLEVEVALAEVEGALGIIPAESSAVLAAQLRLDRIDLSRYVRDVGHTGFPIVPLLEQLTELVPADHGQYLHWGATSQDIMDTALVLQMREAFGRIATQITNLRTVLARHADEYRLAVMPGRSQLQYAAPVTFGLKSATWLSMFQRHAVRLEQLEQRLYVVQFGGAVGTLAALDSQGIAVQEGLAERLDLGVVESVWHATRDSLVEAVSFIANLSASLGKIGQDVVLLSQTDVAEVRERATPGRGVSSTMPQKHNPIAGQSLMVIASEAADLAGSMLRASLHDHERATGRWMREWQIVPEAFELIGRGLEIGFELLDGIEVDVDRMRANVRGSDTIMSEAVMMALAPHLGRQRAHDVVADAVQTATTEQMSFRSVLLSDPDVVRHVSAADLDDLLAPGNYLGATELLIDRVLLAEEQDHSAGYAS